MKITLKAARVNAGLTQQQAAEKIGISKDTICNWERGATFPNTRYIKMIEKIYRVEYKDIIFLN